MTQQTRDVGGYDSMEKLLEEVQKTLRENQLFIQKLKDEDTDLETEEDAFEGEQDPEAFEEL